MPKRLQADKRVDRRLAVVIEVSGGVVQAVFSDLPIDVVLIDWDNLREREGYTSGQMPCHTLAYMMGDTGLEFDKVCPTPASIVEASKLKKKRGKR